MSCPFMSIEKESMPESMSIHDNPHGNCPFSQPKNDIDNLRSQASDDHFIAHDMNLNTLNRYLPETKVKKTQDYLENPQLAFAMKEGTKIVHKAAENSTFTKRFLQGDISRDEYGRYINSLYFVYKTMEDLLAQHKDNPMIQNVYFPHELDREKNIIKDLEYYYGKDRVAKLIDFKNMTPAVKRYIDALKSAVEKNPALLIAHSYTRYLGDLSGGQILAKRLKKYVLHLDVNDTAWDSYKGLEFYHFNHIKSHNEFKNLYRKRLDESRVTEYTRDIIVAEAIHSFELNIGLFDEIQELSDTNQLEATIDYSSHSSRLFPSADWMVGFMTGAATLAFGFSVYQRISNRI